VLLVQDALPASDDWLAALVAPLLEDRQIAGAFARQRPRDDASAITRCYGSRSAAASSVGRMLAIDRAAFSALPPLERLERCTFDNVCSCIRRSVWIEHPFRATPCAEDLEWAREVLLSGYRLAYVPRALVIHSHDRSARYEFARTRALHRRLFELFELRTIPTLPLLARAIASSIVLHVRCRRQAAGDARAAGTLTRALALAVAWPLGQYVGALSAVRGWQPFRSNPV
jgi:rhamnosyltransferase